MKLLTVISIFVTINLVLADLNVAKRENSQRNKQLHGIAVDEVVVESSLYIKPKQQRPQLRRVRKSILNNLNTLDSLIEHRRVKRQFDQLQAAFNAAAHQNYK